MTIQEAKQIDIVDYLWLVGHQPAKIKEANYWYHSPLPNRQDRTPSFKVNRRLNRWYDWGIGKGGDLVALGVLLHECSTRDFLYRLRSNHLCHMSTEPTIRDTMAKAVPEPTIKILSVHHLSTPPLLRYVQNRRINLDIAYKYCQEVRYQLGSRTSYALALMNDAGGFELRSPFFKGSNSPKDSTFIDNGSEQLAVFEGLFDFLSHRTILEKTDEPVLNFLILNSLAFFEKRLPLMLQHKSVHLFLDNDAAGQKCSRRATELDPDKFSDLSGIYAKFHDLNDWVVRIGMSIRAER